ncbi:MAG: DUF2244 domain-containing protein [Casimicrobiaceae bacterium]|nr:DUF2244 domain-containing protein [Casimicrobiaceae bacterium]
MSGQRWVWQRRWASSRRLRWGVFAALSALSVAYSVFLIALTGGWPILPFVGLDLLAVGLAFLWIECRSFDFDEVEIDRDHVHVRQCRLLRVRRHRFDRAWVQVSLESSAYRGGSLRLAQSGLSVRLAEFLDDRERRAALQWLRSAIAS